MKNIYLDVQPTLGKKTGIGWYTYKIVEKLFKNKKNNYIAGFFNLLGRHKIEKIEGLYYKEIRYFWPHDRYGGLFSKKIFRWNFISFNKLTGTKSDIYHFFNFIIPKKIEGKVLVTIHDTIHKETTAGIGFDIDKFDKELIYSLEKSNIVITVSNAAKQDIIKHYGKKYAQKIRVVEPGVDLEEYNYSINSDEKIKILERYNIKKENEIIFSLGTLQERKNMVSIIKAYNSYKEKNLDSKLVLILAGSPGKGYEKIMKEYEESKYKENIRILHYISEEEKILLYKLSKIFIFPSLYEGFGMPIVEAMAAGVPVITSNISSMPEVVGDAAILVNPYSVDEITSAITKIIENEELEKEMIKKGLEQAKKYTWENSVKKLEKIYSEL